MRNFILLTLLFLSACTTVEFVRKDTLPVKKAVLRHSVPSDEKKSGEYRAKINSESRAFCGGDFVISKEYQALQETGGSAGIGTGFGVGGSTSVFFGSVDRRTDLFNFVEIECK